MAILTETTAAAAVARTGRSCKDCSLCCRVHLTVEAGQKPGGWCPHCRPGAGGCSIYATRPEPCRTFVCGYLTNDVDFDDRWFPKTAGIVVDFVPLGPDRFGLRFNVDCRRPNRWREEPYLSKIRAMALSGLRGHRGKKWLTFVVVAPKPWLLVLSHGEVEYRPGARIVQVTPDRFEQRAAALTGVASL
jgi:hypothetical protein